MKYAWLVIGVLAARFVTTAVTYPPGDGDLFWQRALGASILRTHVVPRALGADTFTAAGAPWVPQEWLFGIAAYLGRSGLGWDVFAGGCALAALGALAIASYHAVRRGASPRAVALCVSFAGYALFESFGVRAQVAAWPMLALLLLCLDIDGPWCYAAIAVAAFWSNWHASAMLAPILAGAYAFGSGLDERSFGPRTRRLALVAAASLVAICANPFGWDLPRYAIGLFNNPIKQYINEWSVTNLGDNSFVLGALPLLVLAAVFGTRSSAAPGEDDHRWRDLFALCAFTFLVLSAARNIGVFGIAALPIVAPALSRRVAWFARVPEPPPSANDRVFAVAMPVFTFALAITVAVRLIAAAPPATELANAPMAALSHMPGDHNVYCSDFAWCSLALGTPHERVFLDGRADPYPRDVWEDWVAILRLNPAWQSILERRGVNAMVLKRNEPLDQALALVPGWRVAYADKTYRLWTRS
jgi:hypothetical protein